MNYFGAPGATDEWYTPAYIFDALGETFDLDPANGAPGGGAVPCLARYASDGLALPWSGFVWLNPPFGGRNGIAPWLDRFFRHGNGVALAPDRTSAPWFQSAARRADLLLFIAPKVRFLKPDGTRGGSPGDGTVLFATGNRACKALERAKVLGFVAKPVFVELTLEEMLE